VGRMYYIAVKQELISRYLPAAVRR
jgi:hypothetical protein